VLSDPASLAILVFRLVIGAVFIAHGYNHLWGPGKVAGTARWFASIGMRPPLFHAWVASVTELGAGLMLILGLLTPLAGAAVIGVMVVAWIANHRKNGFFIFRPGEGYEYVMTLTAAGVLFTGVGGGHWSLDALFGIANPPGWPLTAFALAAGFVGAAGLLAACWRPGSPTKSA